MMQTFLTDSSFILTASQLDNSRLWGQVREADFLLRVLREETKGYKHHPVTKMWRGYSKCLKFYRDTLVKEWVGRRLTNPPVVLVFTHCGPKDWPRWIYDEKIYSSHRANLLYKDYAWYSNFGWKEKPSNVKYYPV